ncbi:MAG: DUF523 and DUF1722 domain-containing protein [Candidatus Krumholzibacteriaceae bacterium]|jgi:uncharacterized protein YbgA (DUF1722 family)/uncharacterized protein YbbK (DUF523 family)
MGSLARPAVVVSKCLGFAACRYNGLMISSDVVKALMPFVDSVPVCPEIEIGLGVPRDPIRVATGANGLRLLQPSTGADVTGAMVRFAASFLGSLPVVDGFILKNRSPSCGIKDVKIYRGVEKEAAVGKGAGFFGAAVLAKFPAHPVEDEGRLMNLRIREHFLTSLYALTRFRVTRGRLAMRDLVDYQARNKLLLMSYNQKEMRILGKIVANPDKKATAVVFDEYEAHLRAALAKPPKYTSNINVAMHALGYFKEGLTGAEKNQFLATLERYRAGKIPLSAAIAILNSWIARFDEGYLRQQTFFEPYPEALVEITGS